MAQRVHTYEISLRWTGNRGTGTSDYGSYDRAHEISVQGKEPIKGSADSAFRGDAALHNPEELLVSSVAACHMLWYLHLCSDAGVVVLEYEDRPEGTMEEGMNGGGRFTTVALRPRVVIERGGDPELAVRLHEKAHQLCFVANSVNFPVICEPKVQI